MDEPNDALAMLRTCFAAAATFRLNPESVEATLKRLEEPPPAGQPPGTVGFIPVAPDVLHELLIVWKTARAPKQ